ncbi:MAG: hypothetical protein ABIQ32_12725 [Sphingomicrobium sp.]
MNEETLWSFVESLRHHDIAPMSEAEVKQFSQRTLERFKAASMELVRLALPEAIDRDEYLWHVEPPDYYGTRWLGTFKLRSISDIEANLGQQEEVRTMFAVLPEVMFSVDLLGTDNESGPARSDEPELELVVRANTDSRLAALEEADPELCDALVECPEICDFELTVRPTENACDDFVSPPNLKRALAEVTTSVRRAARANRVEFLQGVEVRLSVPWSASPSAMHEAVRLMGLLFLTAAVGTSSH